MFLYLLRLFYDSVYCCYSYRIFLWSYCFYNWTLVSYFLTPPTSSTNSSFYLSYLSIIYFECFTFLYNLLISSLRFYISSTLPETSFLSILTSPFSSWSLASSLLISSLSFWISYLLFSLSSTSCSYLSPSSVCISLIKLSFFLYSFRTLSLYDSLSYLYLSNCSLVIFNSLSVVLKASTSLYSYFLLFFSLSSTSVTLYTYFVASSLIL